MKVSEAWLKEWVDYSFSGQELQEQLTRAGLEVESRMPVSGEFSNVVVGQVLETRAHPNAQKLTICDVTTGKETLQIICGAPNVCKNLKVAVALDKAVLPGNFKIKETKLRGELSQGMLCSYKELGIDRESEGIIELADDAPVGMPFVDYLFLNDHVLDIDITPNRADCLSILGVAREVAALNNLKLKKPELALSEVSIDDSLDVHIDNPELCPQYAGRVIKGISSKVETPIFIKERLLRCGIRPKYLVVDITNYVMLEFGQPMHAFQLEKIKGDIRVRTAKENEILELLDETQVTLKNSELVIADDEKALALAGIMGAKDSAIGEVTEDIFLESALFMPRAIMGVARRFALTSDSAQRFERGVDKALQVLALNRATELILKIAGGKAGPITLVSDSNHLPEDIKVEFNPEKVKRLTGLAVEMQLMQDILTNLGCSIVKNDSSWSVRVPSYRYDLKIAEDLIEEILRINGYDKLPSHEIPAVLKKGSYEPLENVQRKLSNILCNRGYSQAISYSFVDPKLQSLLFNENQTLDLLNPISQELSQMRISLLPGLLAALIYNLHRQINQIRLFETGVVFLNTDNKIIEQNMISGLLAGDKNEFNWVDEKRKFDFYDLKGDVEILFKALNIENPTFAPASHEFLHPGKSAQISVNNKVVGYIGALHPKILDVLDITSDIFVFEIACDVFLEPKIPQYKYISKYPKIRRDLSFLIAKEVSRTEVENTVSSIIPQDKLKGFEVFDVYMGKNVPEGKKSLAIALTLQDDHRTLVDNEINDMIKAVVQELEEKFSIILREQ